MKQSNIAIFAIAAILMFAVLATVLDQNSAFAKNTQKNTAKLAQSNSHTGSHTTSQTNTISPGSGQKNTAPANSNANQNNGLDFGQTNSG